MTKLENARPCTAISTCKRAKRASAADVGRAGIGTGRPPSRRPPTDSERTLIIDAQSKIRRERVAVKVKNNADGTYVGPEHADARGWEARLKDAFGTSSDAFAISQLNKLLEASRSPKGAIDETSTNSSLAVVDGVRPRDEVEAMLASQMAITHSLAMECLARAKRVDQIPQLDCSGNLAVKLLRTYTMQMEALAKLRRGGEQKVIVEHVHVYPGGQAIVGNVGTAPGAGCGTEIAEQSHGAASAGVVVDENGNGPGVRLRMGKP